MGLDNYLTDNSPRDWFLAPGCAHWQANQARSLFGSDGRASGSDLTRRSGKYTRSTYMGDDITKLDRRVHDMNCLQQTLHTISSTMVLLACFCGQSAAATLFSTVRDAKFYMIEDGDLHQVTQVPAETLVVGTRQTEYQSQSYFFVRFLRPNRQPGWICETDLPKFPSSGPNLIF